MKPKLKNTAPTPESKKPAKTSPSPRSHARLGPSGYKSVEICPSYISTPGDSAASIAGTKLHDLLERFGINVKEEPEFEFLDAGEKMLMLEKIVDYVEPYEKSAKKIDREVQLDLTSYKLPDTEFGTADLIITENPTTLHLMDYKFGKLEVDDAEENIQIWIYVLGAFVKYPKAKTIGAHVLQPARDEISTASFSRDDIPMMVLRARTIAERRAKRSGVEFNPVVQNCLWCNNKANCVALHNFALKSAKYAALVMPAVTSLQPEDLNDMETIIHLGSDIYDLAKLMEGWSDAMKRKITQLTIDGHEITGKRLRQVGGKSSVKSVPETIDYIEEVTGSPREEILAAVADVSITKAENYVASLAPKGDKGKAKDELRAELGHRGYIQVGNPSAYLVDEK